MCKFSKEDIVGAFRNAGGGSFRVQCLKEKSSRNS